jgi:uncharacterized repeat protein (TIGR03803 family)
MKFTIWNQTLRCACLGLGLAIALSSISQAQTFNVIHNFTGQSDGRNPEAGLTIDGAGNLYGTAFLGRFGGGTVYRLRRAGSGWVLDVLHTFTDPSDGSNPAGRVTFGADGALYGVTKNGGSSSNCVLQGGGTGCGTVFKLRLPAHVCRSTSCPWTENVLYVFPAPGGSDGAFPSGDLTFDQQGNIYGTTSDGGSGACAGLFNAGCGTVYELTTSGGSIQHTVLYAFQGPVDNYADGAFPESGVILDAAGNLYGTAAGGGLGGPNGYGVIFELTPSASGWSESVLYNFTNGSDGGIPMGGLIFDGSGNLYGATTQGGSSGGGTAYELTGSMGSWSFSPLYGFSGGGAGPYANLTMDAAGNLYGTTYADGAHGYGSVFKLTPSSGGWTYTSLHDFTGGSDGGGPASNVVFDRNGNLYGTASSGGLSGCSALGCGLVWEITP